MKSGAGTCKPPKIRKKMGHIGNDGGKFSLREKPFFSYSDSLGIWVQFLWSIISRDSFVRCCKPVKYERVSDSDSMSGICTLPMQFRRSQDKFPFFCSITLTLDSNDDICPIK
jgi:hypothetical protein